MPSSAASFLLPSPFFRLGLSSAASRSARVQLRDALTHHLAHSPLTHVSLFCSIFLARRWTHFSPSAVRSVRRSAAAECNCNCTAMLLHAAPACVHCRLLLRSTSRCSRVATSTQRRVADFCVLYCRFASSMTRSSFHARATRARRSVAVAVAAVVVVALLLAPLSDHGPRPHYSCLLCMTC